MTSTVTGLLLTTDLNGGDRVPLLMADDGDRLDLRYLSGALLYDMVRAVSDSIPRGSR